MTLKDNDRWPDNKNEQRRRCINPGHNFPNMLVIPPGKSHTHTCPGCGETTTAKAPNITC